ncbi:MAG: hypothetical protein U9P42_02815 [Candidatus Fermentibacteria bacterium]|nr:hypothetical protein [Candidatus Fermentibacteria bacterium]
MDAAIKQTITGYTAVFDSFTISDDALKKDIEDFINDFNTVGENSSDVMDFMAKFPASGLQEKYSNLIARASAPPPVSAETNAAEEKPAGALPTVKEFLEQYRESYNAVKSAGYRKRAEKAYENIFAVADRADNLIDMNIILEREQLLWKIVTEDLLDIYQTVLDATDPLNLAVVSRFQRMIKTCGEATCDEDLAYRTEVDISINQKQTYRLMSTIYVPVMLAKSLMEYDKMKRIFRTWLEPEKDLLGVISQRGAVKKTYEFIKKTYGWDFDYIANDQWMRMWLIAPTAVDANARIRKTLDPQNIETFRKQLFDDVLSDRTIDDILLTEQERVLFFALDKREKEVIANYTKAAEELNADIVFFQYLDQLKTAAAGSGIKLPGADQQGQDR